MANYYRIMGPKMQRLGIRGKRVETVFSKLPPQYRAAEVFLAIAEGACIEEDRARAHWTGRIALLEANPPEGNRVTRGGRRG